MGDKNGFFDFKVTPKTIAKVVFYLVAGSFVAGATFMSLRGQIFSSTPAHIQPVQPQPAQPSAVTTHPHPEQDVTHLEVKMHEKFVSKEQHKADIGHIAETMGRIEGGMKETLGRMERQQTAVYGEIQHTQSEIKEDLEALEDRLEEVENIP